MAGRGSPTVAGARHGDLGDLTPGIGPPETDVDVFCRIYAYCAYVSLTWDPKKAQANFGKHGIRMKREYDFSKGKRGPVIHQRGKTRITIHLDDEVLDAFRERADHAGRGYQTMINEALREHLEQSGERVDADTIRRIVREELRKAG